MVRDSIIAVIFELRLEREVSFVEFRGRVLGRGNGKVSVVCGDWVRGKEVEGLRSGFGFVNRFLKFWFLFWVIEEEYWLFSWD